MMIDLVGKRYFYFALSALIVIPGLVSLLIPPALRPGIEFTSGTLVTLQFAAPVQQAVLRQELGSLGHGDAIIQGSEESTFLIRTRVLGEAERDAQGNVTGSGEREALMKALEERFGSVEVLSFDSVAPIVAQEIVRNASLAVLAAVVGILLYITWAFRQLPSPFRYGVCAIIALVHDTLVVLGLFSIFGKLFGTEIDAMFITATLTVIGYSVHDTIVVFDRIRENLQRDVAQDFEVVVNRSLLETLGRSLSTSLTVVFTLVALLLFGGVTIRTFVLTLLIGVMSGTYSSIFNASQLLVVWEKGELHQLVRRLQARQALARGR